MIVLTGGRQGSGSAEAAPAGQAAGTRCSVLGFDAAARLDEDGGMWPTSWALTRLDTAAEAAITELVRRAAS